MIMKKDAGSRARRCDSGDGHAIVGAERGDEVTFEEPRRRARRRCWPDPDYDDFNDGTEGSKPSVASAKRSALLNAPAHLSTVIHQLPSAFSTVWSADEE
ncbi:hypothetical protein GQ600_24902 [Phytophthora cactorum]|nr:hypothetical protein GQ600_24902 [Phytophthora cactorum]